MAHNSLPESLSLNPPHPQNNVFASNRLAVIAALVPGFVPFLLRNQFEFHVQMIKPCHAFPASWQDLSNVCGRCTVDGVSYEFVWSVYGDATVYIFSFREDVLPWVFQVRLKPVNPGHIVLYFLSRTRLKGRKAQTAVADVSADAIFELSVQGFAWWMTVYRLNCFVRRLTAKVRPFSSTELVYRVHSRMISGSSIEVRTVD